MSNIEELERLAKLKDSGVLTEEEFQAKKAELLDGGKEKPKKKSKVKKIIGWVLAIWILYALLKAILMNSTALAELPKCDSKAAKNTFTEAFNESQFARTLNLSVVELSNISEVSYSADKKVRECQVAVSLNNAKQVKYKFKLNKRKDGSYMLTSEGIE